MSAGTATVSGVVATVGERWRVVLACVLAAVIVGGAALIVHEPPAASVAKVQLSPLRTASGASIPIDLDTEREVGRSQMVASRVSERLQDGSDWSSVAGAVTVGSPSGTQILTFRVTDPDPVRAARIANLFANEYLDFRRATRTRPRPAAADPLTEQIAALEERRRDESGPDAAQIDRQISELEDQRRALERTSISGGRVVAQGTVSSPSDGLPWRLLLGVVALGLLIGCYAALLADRIDPRVRNVRRLAASVGGEARVVGSAEQLREAALSLLVSAHAAQAVSAHRGTTRVAILTPHETMVAGMAEAVHAAARDLQRTTPVVVGSVGSVPRSPDVVVSALASPPLQAAAARGCHAAVIVVGPEDQRAAVEDLVSALELAGVVRCIGWLRPR